MSAQGVDERMINVHYDNDDDDADDCFRFLGDFFWVLIRPFVTSFFKMLVPVLLFIKSGTVLTQGLLVNKLPFSHCRCLVWRQECSLYDRNSSKVEVCTFYKHTK